MHQHHGDDERETEHDKRCKNQAITKQKPPGKRILTTTYTIRYGVLCDRAKLPHLVRIRFTDYPKTMP